MVTLYIVIGVSFVFGFVLLFKGLARLWQRRMIRGGLQGISGLFFIALALLAVAVMMNLYTYHIFTDEQEAAELRIEALGPQFYRVYYIPAQQDARLYELRGDEWQVDARIMKWSGVANLIGLKTVFRMERISGRYHDPRQERTATRTVHTLADSQGLDLWTVSRKYKQTMPWVDAVYGNAAYMPLVDRARFKISVSTSGLVVRAENEIARQAIENWN